MIPQLEYIIKDNRFSYKFNNVVNGFSLPIQVTAGTETITIKPTAEWQHMKWTSGTNIEITNDFLIKKKESK